LNYYQLYGLTPSFSSTVALLTGDEQFTKLLADGARSSLGRTGHLDDYLYHSLEVGTGDREREKERRLSVRCGLEIAHGLDEPVKTARPNMDANTLML
jgi:hypothetical protein